MAAIADRSFRLRTGEAATIRTAAVSDAPAICELYRDVDATTDFLVTQSDERDVDPESRARWVVKYASDPGALLVLAWVGGLLVGQIDCLAHPRRRMAHVADVGMLVRSDWRARGVGTALLQSAIDWARAHPIIEKVALGVMARNERALALYRSFGFAEDGRRVREYRLGPDRYDDAIAMCVLVKPRRPRVDGSGEASGRLDPPAPPRAPDRGAAIPWST